MKLSLFANALRKSAFNIEDEAHDFTCGGWMKLLFQDTSLVVDEVLHLWWIELMISLVVVLDGSNFIFR